MQRLTQNWFSVTDNIQIDEIKVLQKYHETFIHRSFYA